MYKLSNKLIIFSISLILLGGIGWTYTYISSHKTLEEVQLMLAEDSHHGDSHYNQKQIINHNNSEHHEEISTNHSKSYDNDPQNSNHSVKSEHSNHSLHTDHDEHAEHVMHQIHNRPYAALYVAAFFFMMISLGCLAFYAVQFASQAGWSPVLYRVMEAITYYLLPGALIVIIIAQRKMIFLILFL